MLEKAGCRFPDEEIWQHTHIYRGVHEEESLLAEHLSAVPELPSQLKEQRLQDAG